MATDEMVWYDGGREAVGFVIDLSGTTHTAFVSRECLNDHFGLGKSDPKTHAIAVFKMSEPKIRDKATGKVMAGFPEPVVVATTDF